MPQTTQESSINRDAEQQELLCDSTAASYGGTDSDKRHDLDHFDVAQDREDSHPHHFFAKGHVLLAVVAILYGTLNVALRWVYDLPDPPTASALSTVRGWLAAVCFTPFLLAQKRNPTTTNEQSNDEKDANGSIEAVPVGPTENNLHLSGHHFWRVAVELAFWNFGAQALLNIGLESIESARAAFWTQLSVVLTPCLSALFGVKVRTTVWWACGVALAGLVLLSEHSTPPSPQDGMNNSNTTVAAFTSAEHRYLSSSSSISWSLSLGDILCLFGALSWSTYLFRLSAVGDLYDEVQLQASKTFFLAVLYTIWFVLERFITEEPQWIGCHQIEAWLLLFYSALGPGTLADILQQQGQAHVTATVANIILSSEPVFTAIFGRVLLGELTTWSEKLGGGLILTAALVATRE